MTPLETYLQDLREIRSTGAGVKETSYYPALSNLLNEVGKRLKPRVRCVMNLANRGAGLPDGGFFTAEQFQKVSDAEPLPGQKPARGVIEVKSTRDDAWVTADGEQVSRYWGSYRQVLVTNYRDFVLVGQDAEGNPAKLQIFRLADSEKAFWAAAQHPRSFADKLSARFEEYLQRVMRHAAPLATPEDLAWFLASYARDARARIELAELPALATVRTGLEEALGLKFEGEKGEHFFRSSLVQTLFYGVFSAWVLWSKRTAGFQPAPGSRQDAGATVASQQVAGGTAHFSWYETARYLRVPMISKLFQLVASPLELEALKLTEVLDWAGLVLNRVDRASFFKNFQESHAVQYFYEPFLEAFDPELRKELGVWYTPPEILKYMVERVDTVLRQELGLPLGLADKNVYVLDPCCGTGSYLVEVLDRIHRTLKERGEDALTASDLKEAAQKRVFGFEILPAPFVVSHLQLGLLLQNLGAPLSEKARERVAVYLTNALTGWEPPKGPKKQLTFWELQEERDAAEHIKQNVPILVVVGNPPYNSYAGIAKMEEERDLSEAYRTTKAAPPPQGQGLNDLYVRFFRMAERRIVEKTGKGVVCLISNYSWLDGLSYTGMRERYLEAFDDIWIDCLNGDKYKTGKLTPEGEPDPSVFSTEFNREGIQVGTAITLLVRNAGFQPAPGSRQDAGATIAGRQDAGASIAGRQDAGASIASRRDAGASIASRQDAGASIAGRQDGGASIAGRQDAGATIAGRQDAGATIASRRDAGASIAGRQDAGASIAGRQDAGATVAGRQDAGVATERSMGADIAIPPFRYEHVAKRARGYLPHWEMEGATYSVTIRLGDSLPHALRDEIDFERKDIVKTARQLGRDLTAQEKNRLAEIDRRFNAALDAGYGSCFLAQPPVAGLVYNALLHFNGERYTMVAACVMPNHAHVVFSPNHGFELENILHSWKSFTANEANKILGRKGPFWEHEYFDRLVRDAHELQRTVQYVIENPAKAGLRNWKWLWVHEAFRNAGFQPAPGSRQDAGVTVGQGGKRSIVRFRQVWGKTKRQQLLESVEHDRMFPLYLCLEPDGNPLSLIPEPSDLRNLPSGKRPNVSDSLVAFLTHVATVEDAPSAFYHTLAILHSPAYRAENSGALRQDWPRIPLPASKDALLASAALGKQVAALLDTETEVGAVREPPLRGIAAFVLQTGMTLNEPEHLAVTAGWGHAGQGGVTMPGKGKIVERDYTAAERTAGFQPAPGSRQDAGATLGDCTCDVYLNDFAYWSNIPIRVWEYTIGGYQIMKKWLSYRELDLLGRPLTKEEVRYVQEMARRIAAIILLEPALDANYHNVKAHAFPWSDEGKPERT